MHSFGKWRMQNLLALASLQKCTSHKKKRQSARMQDRLVIYYSLGCIFRKGSYEIHHNWFTSSIRDPQQVQGAIRFCSGSFIPLAILASRDVFFLKISSYLGWNMICGCCHNICEIWNDRGYPVQDGILSLILLNPLVQLISLQYTTVNFSVGRLGDLD